MFAWWLYGIKHLVIEDNTSMGNYESPWTWEILSTSQNCSMVTMMNKPMGCWGTLFQTNTVRFHGPGRSSPLVETTIGGVLMVILFAVFFFYLGCWWCLVEFCLVNWRLPPREKKGSDTDATFADSEFHCFGWADPVADRSIKNTGPPWHKGIGGFLKWGIPIGP